MLYLLFYHKVKKNKRNTKGILNKTIGHIQNQNFHGYTAFTNKAFTFLEFWEKKKENDEKKIIYDPVTAKVAGKKQNW